MGAVTLGVILQGSIWFVGITLFGLIPFLGFFAWLVSIGVWVYLTSGLVNKGKAHLARSDNPSVPAMGWAALMGAATGFVGALSSLIVQAVILTGSSGSSTTDGQVTAAGAAFGTLGAMIGLIYWPAIGAIICGIFGLVWGGRAKQSVPAPTQASTS